MATDPVAELCVQRALQEGMKGVAALGANLSDLACFLLSSDLLHVGSESDVLKELPRMLKTQRKVDTASLLRCIRWQCIAPNTAMQFISGRSPESQHNAKAVIKHCLSNPALSKRQPRNSAQRD